MLDLNNQNISSGLSYFQTNGKLHNFLTDQTRSSVNTNHPNVTNLDKDCGTDQTKSTYFSCYVDHVFDQYNLDNPNTKVNYNYREGYALTNRIDAETVYYVFGNNDASQGWGKTNSLDNQIDHAIVVSGRLPTADNEVMITPNYASAKHLSIGSVLTIESNNNIQYNIVGTGYIPDQVVIGTPLSSDNYHSSFLVFTKNEFCKYVESTNPFKQNPTWGCSDTAAGVYSNQLLPQNLLTRISSSINVRFVDQTKTQPLDKFNQYMLQFFTPKDVINPNNPFGKPFIDAYDRNNGLAFGLSTPVAALDATIIFAIVITLFLCTIAVLIMFFGLRQIINESHKQLGTIKANGYSQFATAMSFVPYAFFPALIGGIIAFGVGMIIQYPVNDMTWKYYQLPLDNFHFEITTMLICVLGPCILFSLIAFIFTYFYIGKNVIQLILTNTNEKSNRLASKVSVWLDEKEVRFTSKLKIAFLMKSFGKLGLIFFSLLTSSMLITISLTSNSTYDSMNQYSFGNLNYKYSYTLDPNALWKNSVNDGAIQIVDNTYFASHAADDLNTESKFIAASLSGDMVNKYVSCSPYDPTNKPYNCWFQNPTVSPTVRDSLNNIFPKLVNSNFNNPNGKILFNLFVKDADSIMGQKLSLNFSLKPKEEFLQKKLTSLDNAQITLLGIDQNSAKAYNLWDKSRDVISSKIFSYQWDGNISSPIPVMISSATAAAHNIKIGMQFSADIENFRNGEINQQYQLKVLGISYNLAQDWMYTPAAITDRLIKQNFANSPPTYFNQVANWITFTGANNSGSYFNNYTSIDFNKTIFDKYKSNPQEALNQAMENPIFANRDGQIMDTSIQDVPRAEILMNSWNDVNKTIFNLLGAFSSVLAVVIIFITCNLTLSHNKKIIAIMHTMGYKQRETNSIFVGMYTPFVFIGAVAGIPLGFVVTQYMLNIVSPSPMVWAMPIILFWWQIVVIIIVLMLIYFICYLVTYILARRSNLITMLQ